MGRNNSINNAILSLIKEIGSEFEKKSFEKYIHYVVFPNYKNIVPKQKINFDFPLAALVGANGTGKTSILHALYGMPHNQSLEKFWFATALDAIEEGGGLGQHRLFYGHFFSKDYGIVETRKARVTKKKRTPEYWEPTKPVARDGMKKVQKLSPQSIFPGRSIDRWNPVLKHVVYINFKERLSAYDKYMYFGRSPSLSKLKSKQDRIRQDAKHLENIVRNEKKSYIYYGKECISENRELNDNELRSIQAILDRKYLSARLIRHSFFSGASEKDGLSIVFRNKDLCYSEAHAGSGEIAIVSAVIDILSAEKNSLILLDEPEVSLHPRAQKCFLKFLLEQIKINKHQVILSTHSPEFVRFLPSSAIKLMYADKITGRFGVHQNVLADQAFYEIGAPLANSLTIYVEDKLAKAVVDMAIESFNPEYKKLVSVEIFPGGAEAILAHHLPGLINSNQKNYLLILDGDQKKNLRDYKNLTISETAEIEKIVMHDIGIEPKFCFNGPNTQKKDKQEAYQKYMEAYRQYVRTLPLNSPENFVLLAVGFPEEQVKGMSSKEAKTTLAEKLKYSHEEDQGLEILGMQKLKLREGKENIFSYLEEIYKMILPALNNTTPRL